MSTKIKHALSLLALAATKAKTAATASQEACVALAEARDAIDALNPPAIAAEVFSAGARCLIMARGNAGLANLSISALSEGAHNAFPNGEEPPKKLDASLS